jgi:hypothetical protein
MIDLRPPADTNTPYSQLLALADTHGHRAALHDFLFRLNAPPNLFSFKYVAMNVGESLEFAKAAWRETWDDWGIDDWLKVVKWVARSQFELAAIDEGIVLTPFIRGRHTMDDRGLARHAVYCAAFETAKTEHRLYRLLQAHLLFAHAKCLDKYGIQTEDYEHFTKHSGILDEVANPLQAALMVRTMHEGHDYLLRSLGLNLPPNEFLGKLEKDFANNETVRPLLIFLQKALGDLEQEKRGSYTRVARKGDGGSPAELTWRWEVEVLSGDFEDPSEVSSSNNFGIQVNRYTKRRLLTEAERQELDLTDDCEEEEENEDGGGILETVSGENTRPAGSGTLTRTASRHVSRANQHFWWQYCNLIAADFQQLFCRRDYVLHQWEAGARDEKLVKEFELFALIDVMLWTSSSRERATMLTVADQQTPPRQEIEIVPPALGCIATWRIHIPLPERKKATEVPQRLRRNMTEWLDLPDVADASRMALELAQWSRPFGALSGMRIFNRSDRWYKSGITRLLKLHGVSRLTESRVASFLFERVLECAKSDTVSAVLVTGRKLPGMRARLHYVCRPVTTLQKLYTEAVEREAGQLRISAFRCRR